MQITVNDCNQTLIEFKIHAFLENQPRINVTSETIKITIIPAINHSPFFVEQVPESVTYEDINPENEGVVYQLGQIWDD